MDATAGQFTLRQLAWRPIVVWAVPFLAPVARAGLGVITATDCDYLPGRRGKARGSGQSAGQRLSSIRARDVWRPLSAWSGRIPRHTNRRNVILIDDPSKSGVNEIIERLFRLGLITVAAVALAVGLAMWATGHAVEASWIWAIGTIPVAAGLAPRLQIFRLRIGLQ
jgi:hypothetical protein